MSPHVTPRNPAEPRSAVRAPTNFPTIPSLAGARRPGHLFTVVAFALTLTLLASGCSDGRKGPARLLLDSVSKAVRKLNGASRQFSEVLATRVEGKATDEDFSRALTKFRETIVEQRAQTDEWTIPETPEAVAFVAAYRQNLDRRVELLDEYGPRILDTLVRSTLPRPQRVAAAKEVVAELAKKADVEIANLRVAQRTYSTAMGVFTGK